MIQRIQTLYLLCAAVLCGLAFAAPISTFMVGESSYRLLAYGLGNLSGEVEQWTIYMAIIFGIGALLPLATIFMFKNRMLQIRMCGVELALLVGAVIFESIYSYLFYKAFSGEPMSLFSLGWGSALPVVSLLLIWLAMKAILKDEVLVKSLDRIR